MPDSAVVEPPLDFVPVTALQHETEGEHAFFEIKQPGMDIHPFGYWRNTATRPVIVGKDIK